MHSTNDDHPFERRPHRTLLALSFPALLSLIAEPLTRLVDTRFVAELGEAPLAALGMAGTVLSSTFWVFSFLGVGAQTEIASAAGVRDESETGALTRVAIVLGGLLGTLLGLVMWPLLPAIGAFMKSPPDVLDAGLVYLEISLLGAPAMVLTMAGFGVMRGLHDMKSPLWIAIAMNALNVVLDWALIFGVGPIPALGIAGAAWATVASQWVGVALVLVRLRGAWRGESGFRAGHLRVLMTVGRDMFIRTGSLSLFLILTTRAAQSLGEDAGAVHQVVQRFWFFSALFLDAYALAAQTLIAHFVGAGRVTVARRVAGVSTVWSVGTGAVWTAGMLAATGLVGAEFVPGNELFVVPWILSAIFQPVNAVSFITDGVHWGTRDWRYLRNALVTSTLAGGGALLALEAADALSLENVWVATAGWITLRAAFGAMRIWPGIGRAPLAVGK